MFSRQRVFFSSAVVKGKRTRVPTVVSRTKGVFWCCGNPLGNLYFSVLCWNEIKQHTDTGWIIFLAFAPAAGKNLLTWVWDCSWIMSLSLICSGQHYLSVQLPFLCSLPLACSVTTLLIHIYTILFISSDSQKFCLFMWMSTTLSHQLLHFSLIDYSLCCITGDTCKHYLSPHHSQIGYLWERAACDPTWHA